MAMTLIRYFIFYCVLLFLPFGLFMNFVEPHYSFSKSQTAKIVMKHINESACLGVYMYVYLLDEETRALHGPMCSIDFF